MSFRSVLMTRYNVKHNCFPHSIIELMQENRYVSFIHSLNDVSGPTVTYGGLCFDIFNTLQKQFNFT